MDKNKKTALYKWVKIGGILSFIPFVLAAGPLAGLFLGNYLEKRFNLPSFTSIALIAIGIIGSVRETVRIIRIALRSEGE